MLMNIQLCGKEFTTGDLVRVSYFPDETSDLVYSAEGYISMSECYLDGWNTCIVTLDNSCYSVKLEEWMIMDITPLKPLPHQGLYNRELEVVANRSGKKFSDNKPRFTLIDPWVEEQCAKARLMGNKKYCPEDYTDTNWMNVEPPEQYLDAAYRHLNKHRQGELQDDESGLPHLIYAITNLQLYAARVLDK